MTVELQKKWHIASVRTGSEKKAIRTLQKKGVEVFFPEKKSTGDRRRTTHQGLFPNYVFLHITEDMVEYIYHTMPYLNFVYWLKKPAIICEEEISTIRRFIAEYEMVSVEKSYVNQSEKIKIINGPLMMWEGNIVEVKTDKIKITLPSLGYSLVASIQAPRYDNVQMTDKIHAAAV